MCSSTSRSARGNGGRGRPRCTSSTAPVALAIATNAVTTRIQRPRTTLGRSARARNAPRFNHRYPTTTSAIAASSTSAPFTTCRNTEPVKSAIANCHACLWPRRTPRANSSKAMPAIATRAAAACAVASGTMSVTTSNRCRSGGVTADATLTRPASAIALAATRRGRTTERVGDSGGGHDGPCGKDATTAGRASQAIGRATNRSILVAPRMSMAECTNRT